MKKIFKPEIEDPTKPLKLKKETKGWKNYLAWEKYKKPKPQQEKNKRANKGFHSKELKKIALLKKESLKKDNRRETSKAKKKTTKKDLEVKGDFLGIGL